MFGFSPLASSPLGDDGQVSTHSLTFNEITTTPVVDTAPVFEGEQFTFNDIVTGAPVIDAIGTPVASNFVADNLVSSAPVVDNVNIDLIHVLNANDVTATPVVDTATTAFTDVLNATSLGPEVTNYTVTVADNYGNKFYIDGVSNPTLTFVPGQKYVFDVSDATNEGHPFRFKYGLPENSYTTGVTVSGTAGQSGATVTILVASDATTGLLLRYYCTVHGNGMGNTIGVSSQALDLQPQIDTVGISVTSNFAANEITTGVTQVDALPFFQEYALTVVDIVTGAPTLPARFVWDFQELAAGDWSDLALTTGVWTDQLKNPENWSGINLSSGTWSDEAQSGGSWQDAA